MPFTSSIVFSDFTLQAAGGTLFSGGPGTQELNFLGGAGSSNGEKIEDFYISFASSSEAIFDNLFSATLPNTINSSGIDLGGLELLLQDSEGNITQFVSGGFDIVNISSFSIPEPAPVPEPTTMLLLGAGLVCLAGSRLRKKSDSS